MEYPQIYEVRYLDKRTGEYKTYDRTDDLSRAEYFKMHLIKAGQKDVHIQHSFAQGGIIEEKAEIGFKKSFLDTPIVYGREIEISMPNGEKHKAQFAVVDADNIIASHNENNFSTSKGYPVINGENINDRNYADDKNAQAKVIEVAQTLDPNILISTSRTPSGTPIITKDGIVVSGNNRTMSIKLAIKKYPEQYKKYVDFLKEEIFAFGIENMVIYYNEISITDKDNVTKKIKHPILVRIDYDFPAYNTTELSKYNKETKKSERPIDKAIKIGKILQENEGCKNIVSELVGNYETFSQFYSSHSDQLKLRDTLIDCNIITKNDLAAYFDERGFTENGKELIENLLAGMVLSKEALIAGSMAGGRQFKQIIITSLPVLAKNASLADFSLIETINKAFLLQKTMHDANLDFKDYMVQENMFEEKPEKNVIIMNRLLAEGRNKFKSSIDAYNNSAIDNQNESLFGDKPTKQEMFDTFITNKIQPEILKMINDTSKTEIFEPNTPESFDEAIFSQIQPTDSWKGHLFKERHILSQIANLVKGPETEKEAEVKRLFFEYAKKFDGELSTHIISELGESPIIKEIGSVDEAGKVKFATKQESEESIFPLTPILGYINEKGQREYQYAMPYNGSYKTFYSEKENFEDAKTDIENQVKRFNLIRKFDKLAEIHKSKFGNADIESPMSAEEKQSNKELADTYSKINSMIIEKRKSSTLYLLKDDNWFNAHPDKVLGEPYQVSGRFGPVTKYKGKIDAVNRIDAPLNFMQINEAENPTLSTENESVSELMQDPQALQNIETALVNTKAETAILKVKKSTKAVSRVVASNAVKDADMYSFEEVYKQNNPEISDDELKSFVWYKESIGETLSDKWYKLSGLNKGASPAIDWINNGLLCYFRGTLIPAYLYFSGNIWEKKTAIESDKANIIELYGASVYENQKLALDNVFKISYDKRLTLTNANFDNRLKILPISKFANTFMINTLVDGREFKMKAQPKGGKQPGRPEFLYAGYMSDWKKTKYEQLSLTEAFQYWLVEYKGEYHFKKDTTYADIIKIYINQGQRPSTKDLSPAEQKEAEAIWQRKLNITKEEGDRLFSIFLSEWINVEDIVKIETTWNEKFNGFVPVNYNKIPIAFSHAKEYRNSKLDVRPEKREAVAFLMNEGSGCLAYDVGVGKTFSALFAIKQFLDAGYCKRPMVVVPNQVYKQFLAEGKGLFPDTKFNDLYNLSKDYISELKDANGNIEMVSEGSISILTYEGFSQIGFNENTANSILTEMANILDQDPDAPPDFSKKGQKKQAAMYQRLEMLVGRGLKGTQLNIEELGFDFACYDEAHKMKKVFVGVKGEMKSDGENREKNPYQIQAGGAPSSIALKGFMISQYILKNNNYRNILTLTATPFTNSPLEIFSVLSFIAYDKLRETGLNNLKSFFDTYVHATNELVINAKLRPERKQVVLGFNNLHSLQQLISRFINYKTGEMVNVQRPNKYVLPYTSKLIGNEVIKLSESERVETMLPLSPEQSAMMADIKAYAEGKLNLSALCSSASMPDIKIVDGNDDEDMSDATEGVELDEDTLDDDEKAGVRTLRAMSYARNLALSPYLYDCSGLSSPTPKQYIESSPKLHYVIECVKSVKKYHEKAGTPVSGQVIYMDRGIEYFELIKKYLIEEVGYKSHEVGIIKSQMPGGKDAKEKVKMAFLGETYDEKSGELIDIPDEQRMKVVIGSSTIKEGINLQKHSTVLYNCFLDWNPTDIKQLEGRIWRQGNLFNSVRIVCPMMEDSMDIFIFQKLQEKTSRIAEIWDTNGESNTFNLAEFNPAEIKAALISDPMVLAELQLIEDKEKIDDEIRGVKNEETTIDKIIEAKDTYDAHIEDFENWVNEYRPLKEGAEKRSFSTLLSLANDIIKNQLDAEGKKMEYSYNRTNNKNIVYSDKSPAHKQYFHDSLVLANRTLQKAEKEYLKPRNLTIAKLPLYKESLKKKIEDFEKIKKDTTSEESIKLRAEYIRAEREANKIERVGVSGRVKEFERLNYLLDEKIQKGNKTKSVALSCPPLDENGVRRIDKDAIEHLMVCINSLPQTKALHTNSDGEYTPERKALHLKILRELKDDVVCIKQEKPIAILTGGAPGSGKTHFLKNYAPYLLSKNVFHIDADEVRAKLPEYKGWNASATHFETKDIVDILINDIGGKCKFDTVYDGTMNKAVKYYELINKLKEVGYDVYIIYIDVPQEVSEKRVLERYQRTGRFVPMDVVREVFDAGHTAFNQIKTMVTGWIQVDGMSGQVVETGGEKIPQDRDYAKLTETTNFIEEQKSADANKNKKLKIAKAKASAQKQRIRIIKINK